MVHREMYARKRDGRLVSFERERISRAIASAFRAELEIPKGEHKNFRRCLTAGVKDYYLDIYAIPSPITGA